MKLILVRHGETKANLDQILQGKSDGELTEKGIEQAKDLGNKLKEKYKIDMIFCSPLDRCVKTLENILVEYEIKSPIFMSKLIEERDFGEYSGVEYQMVDWDEINKNNKVNKEMGLESISDLRKRINLFLEDLKLEGNGLNILVVTHAGPIRMVNDILTGEKFENGKEFDNCSITEFDFKTEC